MRRRKSRNLSPPPKFFSDSARATERSSTPLLAGQSQQDEDDEEDDIERIEISNGFSFRDEGVDAVDHANGATPAGLENGFTSSQSTGSTIMKPSSLRSDSPTKNISPSRLLNVDFGGGPRGSVDGASVDDTPDNTESLRDTADSASDFSQSRRSSSVNGSSGSQSVLGNMMNLAYRKGTRPAQNLFVATAEALWKGLTLRNIVKGFLWSLAITSMHYVGIAALHVPNGHYKLQPGLVILSALISWVVCLVGVILMPQMETHLGQQVFFSAVASAGVAAMHFTGMCAGIKGASLC